MKTRTYTEQALLFIQHEFSALKMSSENRSHVLCLYMYGKISIDEEPTKLEQSIYGKNSCIKCLHRKIQNESLLQFELIQ